MKRSEINHVHGIVVIGVPGEWRFGNPEAGSLGAMVGAYKSAVTRRINQMRDTPGGSVWQPNYHDHIIRTAAAWHRIRRYIQTNPARWPDDTFYCSPST